MAMAKPMTLAVFPLHAPHPFIHCPFRITLCHSNGLLLQEPLPSPTYPLLPNEAERVPSSTSYCMMVPNAPPRPAPASGPAAPLALAPGLVLKADGDF